MINLFLLPYGTDAVAAMGIALKVIMIAVLVFVGFAFGAQPLIGYNYGAGERTRVQKIYRVTLTMCASYHGGRHFNLPDSPPPADRTFHG